MPVVFNLAIKPTPSIGIVQDTVNLETLENTKLAINGRHDPAIIRRIVVVIIAVIGSFIARSGFTNPDSWASSIMAMVENAWGLFGASFGPVVILSLFWKRFNYPGAVAGIVGGVGTIISVSSRKKRIAAGSGTSVEEINRLLKQFNQIKDLMKQFTEAGKKKKKIELDLAAIIRKHPDDPRFIALGARMEKLREEHEAGLLTSMAFLKALLDLAKEAAQMEREVVPEDREDKGKAALTALFQSVRNENTPVIVERIVGKRRTVRRSYYDRSAYHDEVRRYGNEAHGHPLRRFYEPHYDRRHGYVRRLPTHS